MVLCLVLPSSLAPAAVAHGPSAGAATPVGAVTPGSAATAFGAASPVPSIHAEEAAAHAADAVAFEPGRRVDVPLAARGHATTGAGLRRDVFGFLPWWLISSADLRLDDAGLSTIAIFGVEGDRDGHLVTHSTSGRSTPGWAAWTSSRTSSIIAAAHRAGTRVVLTVTRFAWTDSQEAKTVALLTDPAARQRLATEIATAVQARGADGVNLDFEPVPMEVRDGLVALVREVRSALDARRPGYELTFDALRREWLAGYDLANLTGPDAADAVFVMGYEYSGRNATRTGASAPVRRSAGALGPIPAYEDDDLERTLAAYLEQIGPSRVILGLPWYGRSWPSDGETFPALTLHPSSTYGTSGVWPYKSAIGVMAAHGHRYAGTEASGWTAYRSAACSGCPVAWHQLVVDDARSFGAKLDLADRYALRGAGVWALGYDGTRPELRDAVRAHFIPSAGADTTAPAGVVRIVGGHRYAPTNTVRVDIPALDDLGGRGVASVALSNTCRVVDGVLQDATRFPFQGRVTAWALPPGEGTRRVCAQWRDRAGNRSPVRSDGVIVDLVPPTTTAPTASLEPGSVVNAAGVVLRLSWTGADERSGIARYEIDHSADEGDWQPVPGPAGPLATVTWRAAPGVGHRFRVRAVDVAGGIGEWAVGEATVVDLLEESDASIAWSGAWATEARVRSSGGAVAWSWTAGDAATITLTGREVGWVTTRREDRGIADVSVDGATPEPVDTQGSPSRPAVVVAVRTFGTAGAHTLEVAVDGTDARPRVDVDAFVILY